MDATTPDGRKIWKKVSRNVNPRGDELHLWYKAEKPLRDMTQQEKQSDLITEIDVLYGDDDPWYGFEKLERPIAPTSDNSKLNAVWLTIRKGVKCGYHKQLFFKSKKLKPCIHSATPSQAASFFS